MNYDQMQIQEVIEYINMELSKERTMKDIEEIDFEVNKGVIQKRLNRKGYEKINNQFIATSKDENKTTIKTTKIIQTKKEENKPIQEQKRAFNNSEIDKLEQLLNIDIDILNKIVKEYNTKNNTKCSIEIKDNTTSVTSVRLNKELYARIKEYSNKEHIKLLDIFNEMMIDYLRKTDIIQK